MIKPLNKDTTWSSMNSHRCPLEQCCPLHILITYSPQTVSGLTKRAPTGEGNGKPLQYSCLENSMNSESESCSVMSDSATSWIIQSNELSRPECCLISQFDL